MADETHIEWSDATWNIITGCSVVSPGCTNCYAMRLAGTRMRNHHSRQGLTTPSKAGPVWNGQVRFNEAWLNWPLRWRGAKEARAEGRPSRIFPCAHGDLFHEAVPDAWIIDVYGVMVAAVHLRGHIFQILTKRPERARRLLSREDFWEQVNDRASLHVMERCDPLDRRRGDARATLEAYGPDHPPPNIWHGTSAEDQDRLDERMPAVLATPAAVRWLSAEPLLGGLDLRGYVRGWKGAGRRQWDSFSWPQWVPEKVRREIESFWRNDHGRGPDEWLRQARANGQDPLGAIGRYRLAGPGGRRVDGYFVPAWGNMGRVVANGETFVVSDGQYQRRTPYLDWVVVGPESGPAARPGHPDWIREIRDQCEGAGVAFLFKQWGNWAPRENIGPVTGPSVGAYLRGDGSWSRTEFTRAAAEGLHIDDEPDVWRADKKRTGRLLDGVLHHAFPEGH